MNDFNRGALQVPCLRLDYGFGEQWASVELGDGTGYVRLSDYEKAEAENEKLRELIADVHEALKADRAGMFHRLILASMEDDMRELGVENTDD